jgi:signal transduction histidine kinase
LTELRRSHEVTVRELRTLLPTQTARVDSLEERLDDYWQAFEPLFAWSVYEKIVRSARFLRREVLPRREAVLEIAGDIEQLNNANHAAQRAGVSRRLLGFREDRDRRLWRTLLLGFVVALVAVLRLRALESRAERQRVHAEKAEQEMRMLSQQLVAAQEEERKKLTRELHDHVGQMLTALRLEIGKADRAGGGAESQFRQALGEARRLLDTILRSVRDLAMGLRPSMLDDFGLQPALEWLTRDFRRRFNVAVNLTVHGDLDAIPDQYRTCVYRVVQEALTNCARHARATRADVDVRLEQNTLHLRVADDGVGIDPNSSRGAGLLGIEERVRELHGMFRVEAGRPQGTELWATLPVTMSIEEAKVARAAG